MAKKQVRNDVRPNSTDQRAGCALPDHWVRPVIERVRPQVEGGAFTAKAAVGDVVVVEADIFMDGHDLLAADLWVQRPGSDDWATLPMEPLVNDRWRAGFPVTGTGLYRFRVHAQVDPFATWVRDLRARLGVGQVAAVEAAVGVGLVETAARRAKGADRRSLEETARELGEWAEGRAVGVPSVPGQDEATVLALVLDDERFAERMRHLGDTGTSLNTAIFTVDVEPSLARFGTWYEMFPRSASPDSERPGTLADVIDRLDYVAGLGVDVLYLPPIHPIGRTHRKGRDGAAVAAPDDPGSPWAIGSEDGGHTAIHPGLGTLGDLDALVAAAGGRGIAVALDLAIQCSPDHPWVTEHPDWFTHLPDGTIRTAENPPKRYEDIYPINFETEDWRSLWSELRDVVEFWIGHGITIFRVDNPHTKPFAFWEWLLGSVRAEHPEVLFLSEAFTRPRVMERLAKLGFSQSYTYFTWRTTRWELETYLGELVGTEVADYFRPSFWPTTPDILPEELQVDRSPAFVTRLILAATLGATYGIYGPSFELREHLPRNPGSEELANSEKYAVRHWDLDRGDSLAPLISRVNSVRRQHPALQRNDTLRFHAVDNQQLIAYSKTHLVTGRQWAAPVDGSKPPDPDVVLMVVNLDPTATQSGWVTLDLEALGLEDGPFAVHDLLTDAYFAWEGPVNFVQLDPAAVPAHIFAVLRPEPAPADGGR